MSDKIVLKRKIDHKPTIKIVEWYNFDDSSQGQIIIENMVGEFGYMFEVDKENKTITISDHSYYVKVENLPKSFVSVMKFELNQLYLNNRRK